MYDIIRESEHTLEKMTGPTVAVSAPTFVGKYNICELKTISYLTLGFDGNIAKIWS